jgi:hypothetical protein
MLIECQNGKKVDNWYDRRTRQYITQLKDEQGNQIGEALYAGTRYTSLLDIVGLVKTNGGEVDYSKEIRNKG